MQLHYFLYRKVKCNLLFSFIMLSIIHPFYFFLFEYMKKLFLLFITLITFSNISYASFPIYENSAKDTLQTEEIKQYHYNLQKMGIDLSSCKCISCRNGIDPIVIKPNPLPIKVKKIIKEDKREASGSLYVLLSIFSAIGSLLFGLLSLGHAFSHNGSYSSVLLFFILSLISVVGSVILAVKAKKQGINWGVAILGIGISVLAILLLFPFFFV